MDALNQVPQQVDTLAHAQWVIPVEPSGAILPNHSVAVRDGRIVDILPTAQARERYAASTQVDLPQHALIPGLVNAHTHAAMALMRGLADDLPLMTWLTQHIWPAESAHVSAEFVEQGSLLACAEMLLGGVTCCNEMYFFPEAFARAALRTGLRAAIGIITIDFPTAYAADADDYLNKGLAARDRFKDEPLLSFTMAPHAPYTVSDRSFQRLSVLAAELDLPIHCHVHETREEIDQSIGEHQVRPLERLARLGLVGPSLIAVHAVHLSPEDIGLLAAGGASVAHCPTSNLKLASGIAPVTTMQAAGLNVALGTDGAASNNRLDLFSEMRLAALLAKGSSGDAQAVPAHTALAMATINGARALALDHEIGSLKIGKAADMVAVSLGHIGLMPCYDPVSHLVYAAGREHVSHVWVAGKLLIEEYGLKYIVKSDLERSTYLWQNRLQAERRV